VVELSAEEIRCVQCKAQSRQSAKLFLQSSELGRPQPLTRRRVCPQTPGSGGRGTLWRERGWESLNSDEGTYPVVLCIYTYFVVQGQQHIPLLLIYALSLGQREASSPQLRARPTKQWSGGGGAKWPEPMDNFI
jgi:hypothetical protein